MSKQANTTLIGAFVVGAVALLVAGVIIFSTGLFLKNTKKFVLFFQGSVKGLAVGAPVDFRGVKVGSVTDIKVLLDSRDLTLHIPVFIEIDPDRITEINPGDSVQPALERTKSANIIDALVKEGLRAQLGMQSLVTGQLYVLLDFFPGKPIRLVGGTTGFPELPTVQSNLEEITKTFEKLPLDELANKLVAAIEGIREFVTSPELKDTVVALNQSVKNLQNLISNVDARVEPVASNIDKTLTDARHLLVNINGQIKPLAASLDRTVQDAGGLVRNINSRISPLTSTLDTTFAATGNAVKQAEKTLASIDGIVGENSALRYDLTAALKEFTAAARSLRTLTDYLERHPESLLQGKDQQEGK
jgi:paraquat-inducible protein B